MFRCQHEQRATAPRAQWWNTKHNILFGDLQKLISSRRSKSKRVQVYLALNPTMIKQFAPSTLQ